MELVNCNKKYWEFVRSMRTHNKNQPSFLQTINITPKEQEIFMANNSYKYKICLLDEEPVGYIGLLDGFKENTLCGSGEITYCVDPNHTGKGIATFMTMEVINAGSDDIWGECKQENIATQIVLKKCGFIIDFNKKRNVFYKNTKNKS
tara:strand:+ start:120 stop:563 length:444 start_codon:yes stop_codon:yes gene_type:complete